MRIDDRQAAQERQSDERLAEQRADLADRAVFLTLEPIPEERRRPEQELWAAFEAERPRLLGVLLDAVGIEPRHFLRAPAASPALSAVIEHLLRDSDRLYARADLGVAMLP